MAIDLGQEVGPPAPSRLRGRGLQILALALVLGSLLMSFWATPIDSSEAEFGSALAAGDVRAAVRDDGQAVGIDARFGTGLWATSRRSSDVPSILWTTGTGRVYRTRLDTLAQLPAPSATSTSDDAHDAIPGFDASANPAVAAKVDIAASLVATARAAGVAPPDPTSLGWAKQLGNALGYVQVAAFLLLVVGSQPRRFTKWGQFWLLGLPAGAGLFWWVLRDAPFDPGMRSLPEPAPHAQVQISDDVVRRGGRQGFVALLIGSLVLSAVVAGLVQVVTWGARPAPEPGSVTFQVVYDDGQRATLNF
jgi:hypothetical protein